MKKLLLLFIVGISFMQAKAQVEIMPKTQVNIKPVKPWLPLYIIKKDVNRIVNDYKLHLQKAADTACKMLDVEKMCKNTYTKNARMQVSTLGKKGYEERDVRDYYNRLINLRKQGGLYDYIEIKCTQGELSLQDINFLNNTFCYVDIEVGQSFKGFRNNKIAYEDYTRKRIWIVFTASPDGTFDALIHKVTVI